MPAAVERAAVNRTAYRLPVQRLTVDGQIYIRGQPRADIRASCVHSVAELRELRARRNQVKTVAVHRQRRGGQSRSRGDKKGRGEAIHERAENRRAGSALHAENGKHTNPSERNARA